MKLTSAKSILAAVTILVSVAAGPAFAGDWATGYGETISEATENALTNAKAAVASRGSGCVDGKTRLQPKQQGLFVVEMHYSHHNGSCGHISSEEQLLQDAVRGLLH